MRHRTGNKKLGRPADQRLAMLKSIVRALFLYGKVTVTHKRAKEASRMAEKIIAISKKNDLFSRKKIESIMGENKIVTHIFKTIPARFEGRAGGYTRVIKTNNRRGDAAPMAILELL